MSTTDWALTALAIASLLLMIGAIISTEVLTVTQKGLTDHDVVPALVFSLAYGFITFGLVVVTNNMPYYIRQLVFCIGFSALVYGGVRFYQKLRKISLQRQHEQELLEQPKKP